MTKKDIFINCFSIELKCENSEDNIIEHKYYIQ